MRKVSGALRQAKGAKGYSTTPVKSTLGALGAWSVTSIGISDTLDMHPPSWGPVASSELKAMRSRRQRVGLAKLIQDVHERGGQNKLRTSHRHRI